MAKATWFNPAMDLDLFHPLVEDAYTASVPSNPDLVADKFGRNFVISARHFDVTVAMDVAPGFLEARKERVGQRLQVGAFLFKNRQRPVGASYRGSACQRYYFPNVAKRSSFRPESGSAGPSVRCCECKQLPFL